MAYPIPPKEELEELIEKQYSRRDIADYYGCSQYPVARWLKHYGLYTQYDEKYRIFKEVPDLTRQKAQELVEAGASTLDILDMYDISFRALRKQFDNWDMGLPKLPVVEMVGRGYETPPKKDLEQLIERFFSQQDIADYYQIASREPVKRWLKEHSLKTRGISAIMEYRRSPAAPPKQEIIDLIEGGLDSIIRLAEHYSVSWQIVHKWLDEHDIPQPEPQGNRIPAPPKEDLEELIDKGYMKTEIGAAFGSNRFVVDRWLEVRGIEPPDWHEQRRERLSGIPRPGYGEWLSKYYKEHPEKHANYVMAQKGYETSIERKMRLALEEINIEFEIQHPIDGYWADFAILEKKLVIEVDGEFWHDPEQDAERDANLAKLGWTTLRFGENRVNDDIGSCVAEILEVVGGLESHPIMRQLELFS